MNLIEQITEALDAITIINEQISEQTTGDGAGLFLQLHCDGVTGFAVTMGESYILYSSEDNNQRDDQSIEDYLREMFMQHVVLLRKIDLHWKEVPSAPEKGVPTIPVTEEEYINLKKYYEDAKRVGKASFQFHGMQMDTGYAGYVLEFMETFPHIQSTKKSSDE